VDVVDATLVKINSISGTLVQNDFGFLKRIALVESSFGDGTLQYQNGGIWQVLYTEVAASRTSSRTVFEVLGLGLESQVLGLGLGLEGQVLGLEPSRSSKIGLSSVEDDSFLLPLKSYISLKLF